MKCDVYVNGAKIYSNVSGKEANRFTRAARDMFGKCIFSITTGEDDPIIGNPDKTAIRMGEKLSKAIDALAMFRDIQGKAIQIRSRDFRSETLVREIISACEMGDGVLESIKEAS